jgi:hypothetical protein
MPQVSALALSKMLFSRPHDESTWRLDMIAKSPTFQYWDTVLQMEILGLIFVRSHRQQDFSLYVESLKALAPWFFALDHHNYARWIPILIRDINLSRI